MGLIIVLKKDYPCGTAVVSGSFLNRKIVDVMTAAFKEYDRYRDGIKSKKKKPSVRKKLQKTKERKAKQRQRVKTRQKVRGQER